MEKITFGVVLFVLFGLTGSVPAQDPFTQKREQEFLQKIDKVLRDLDEFAAKSEAAKPKISVKEGRMQIEGIDLDEINVAIFELYCAKGHRDFDVRVAPLPRGDIGRLLAGNPEEPRVSQRHTVLEAYIISRDRIIEEIGQKDPLMAKGMKENSIDLRGNLDKIEKFLGLTEAHKGLDLIERCRRIAWMEGVARYHVIPLRGKKIDIKVHFSDK